MKLTSDGQCGAGALTVPEDSFEALRASFLERLKGERQRLCDLGAALAQGKMGRVPILDELRSRAHRLSGTAGIFQLGAVATLAAALELAVDGKAMADRAVVLRVENTDRVICTALKTLIQVIDDLDKPSREGTPRRTRSLLNG
jgi:HPt (histidine-containing phosphotransfer) domain-containing protein